MTENAVVLIAKAERGKIMTYSYEALDSVIEKKMIKTVFQPIVSLRDGSVFGYEALSRITDKSLEINIEDLFYFADKYNRIWELELLCRTTALETAFHKLQPPCSKKLFLNVNPNIMYDVKFRQGFTRDYLNQYKITPEQVIFEITEKNAIKEMGVFLSTISHYKDQNYKIAIDDAGAGYCGLNLISDIRPHFIKLDMKLVHEINLDSIKNALVKSMVELSHIANIHLIAEGIENQEELKTLIDLGVQFGQGYFIQKPNELIMDIPLQVLKAIHDANSKKNHLAGRQASNIFIENLCSQAISVSPNVSVEQVYNLLSKNMDYQGVCVVNKDEVVGVIMKNKLVLQLSGRYGFTLNQNKPISSIMDKDIMCVDYKTPVSTVSNIATLRKQDNMYDFIVVTKNRRLLGTVSVKDLLQKITEIELLNAKYQNPLSGLPGNIEIEQRLNSAIECASSSVFYIDIDNFKAYNDVYGFEKGDAIIKCLANYLISAFSPEHFVGHIGGDDFIVIGNIEHPEEQFENLLSNFCQKVKSFYSEEDSSNGYIIAKNRSGITEQFPLITISVAGAKKVSEMYSDVFSMSEELSAIKKEIKHIGGNQMKFI